MVRRATFAGLGVSTGAFCGALGRCIAGSGMGLGGCRHHIAGDDLIDDVAQADDRRTDPRLLKGFLAPQYLQA